MTRNTKQLDRAAVGREKFYILTDLEGPAGVSSWSQTREPADVNKLLAMDLLTSEVNTAVTAIFGVRPRAEVHVFDGHGFGGINANRLHARAQLFLGRAPDPLAGLDASYRAMLFIGQHAMAGTPDAPLCHTYSSRDVASYVLNGVEIGEIGCRTLLAASVNVPVIFLSGDDKAVAEAKAFQPGIETVTTKLGGGIEWALHLSAAESCAQIRRAVRRAVMRLPRKKSTIRGERFDRFKPPYQLVINLVTGANADAYLKRGGRLQGETSVVFKGDSLLDLPI